MRIKAELIKGEDLRPGDLFSTVGPDYWDLAMDRLSVGERVYIRTNASTPPEQALDAIYRITVVGKS